MNDLATQEKQVVMPVQKMDAMALVSTAVSNGAPIENIDKLIELVKFNDGREALKAFNAAFTLAQAEFPRVKKTKEAHNGLYAPFADIVKQITPVLIKYNFSFRHEVVERNNGVTVTCILAHKDGHNEKASLSADPDKSGSKNSIQAIGSSVTYLKRYTFEAVTGVVTTDEDDDANSATAEPVSTDQVLQIKDLILEISNKEKEEQKSGVKINPLTEAMVLNRYKLSEFEQMSIATFGQAIASLNARKEK